MADNVILTIGIPTYNGAAYIGSTLDSVIRQISDGLDASVDILVSDNASVDDIPKIVKTYQESSFVSIQYSRNDKNLGFDRNVDLLFKKAQGQYVWLLGDDDVLEDGALRYVVDLLNQHPRLKAVQVNFDKYDKNLEKIIQKVDIPENLYCTDADTFLMHSKGRWGAIASLVIDKEAWNKEDLAKGFGSQIIFAYGLFQVLLRGDSYIVKQSLVKVRAGSEKAVQRGDGDALLFIALASGTLYRAMKEMGYGSKIIRWYIEQDRRYVYDAIPMAKLWGLNNRQHLVEKLIAVHNGPALWLKYIPLLYCPDLIFQKLYAFKKGVSSKTRVIERKLKTLIKKRNPIR
jgi:glycosyltransferase involved in cell wall biosynthesis